LFGLFGAAAFAQWRNDKRFEPLLWISVANTCCCFVSICGLSMSSTILGAPAVLSHAMQFAMTCAGVACVKFVLTCSAIRSLTKIRWINRAMAVLLGLSAILAITLFQNHLPNLYARVVEYLHLIIGIAALALLSYATFLRRDSLHAALMVAIIILLTICILCTQLARSGLSVESSSIVYAPLPLMGVMAWVVIRRLARLQLRMRVLNALLKKRVQRRELEVYEALTQLSELQRKQAVRAERDRFMQDMHDGLGSQLITSMRAAERGILTHDAMRDVLLSCLDEMHFAIEALKETGDDLFVVLADYRYRLDTRLEAAGIALTWQMMHTDKLSLSATAVTQTLRIINEAISNALKHASSQRISVQGRLDEIAAVPRYRIDVIDFGSGFAPHASPIAQPGNRGNGLKNMRRRAESIGADVHIHSSGEGTQVSLIFASSPNSSHPLV
jgi:signal transduction histidine kinase